MLTQDSSSSDICDWFEHKSAQILLSTCRLPQIQSSSFFNSIPKATRPARNNTKPKLIHQGRNRISHQPDHKIWDTHSTHDTQLSVVQTSQTSSLGSQSVTHRHKLLSLIISRFTFTFTWRKKSPQKIYEIICENHVGLINTGVFLNIGIEHGCKWLHVTLDDMLVIPSTNSTSTSDLTVCACAWAAILSRSHPCRLTLQWRAWAAQCTSESPDLACCPRVAGRWTAGKCRLLPLQRPYRRLAGTGGGACGDPCHQSVRCGFRPPRPHRWFCGRLGCQSSCFWWSCAASYATPCRLRRRPGQTPLWQR